MTPLLRWRKWVKENPLLVGLGGLFIGLLGSGVITPSQLIERDWGAVAAIFSLFLVALPIERSGALTHLTELILKRVKSWRGVGGLFLIVTAVVAPFFTNDAALLTLLPLLLALKKRVGADPNLGKIAILLGLAANTTSMISPLGNPQNIFLFHIWGCSLFQFLEVMALPYLISLFLLLVWLYLFLPADPLPPPQLPPEPVDQRGVIASIIGLGVVVAGTLTHHPFFQMGGVVILLLLVYPQFWKWVNYKLFILFPLMVVDCGGVAKLLGSYFPHPSSTIEAVWEGVLLSQLVSNFPATLLLVHWSSDYGAIGVGTNLGGNGFLIASVANLIVVEWWKERGFVKRFQLHSLLFLMTTTIFTTFFYF
jgi:Na+/H+ antiporter NhaD/arsenite permease-like protein